MKTVLLRIHPELAKLIELEDGTWGLMAHCPDEEAERLRGNALVDFIEGDSWKDCPSVWKTKDGNPRHIVMGHDIKKLSATKLTGEVIE